MPEVIAKYYLDAVKRNGLPVNVKDDDGTEHSLVQPIHLLLRDIDGSDPDFGVFQYCHIPCKSENRSFLVHFVVRQDWMVETAFSRYGRLGSVVK